jgi:hypothetical protein
MNNSHCPALRQRRRGEAAPSGEAASWLHSSWKGKVTVLCLSAYILPAASRDTARRAWETPSCYYMSIHVISKLGHYHIRLYHLSLIIRIKTLLKHIKTLLFQLLHLEFLTYYTILYHTREISNYINYINPIISIKTNKMIMA